MNCDIQSCGKPIEGLFFRTYDKLKPEDLTPSKSYCWECGEMILLMNRAGTSAKIPCQMLELVK